MEALGTTIAFPRFSEAVGSTVHKHTPSLHPTAITHAACGRQVSDDTSLWNPWKRTDGVLPATTEFRKPNPRMSLLAIGQ